MLVFNFVFIIMSKTGPNKNDCHSTWASDKNTVLNGKKVSEILIYLNSKFVMAIIKAFLSFLLILTNTVNQD